MTAGVGSAAPSRGRANRCAWPFQARSSRWPTRRTASRRSTSPGVQRTINIGLLDEDGAASEPGDWVLIHVGFAISQVDEEEAIATRRQLERMGEDYEAELEELKASVIE